MSDPADRRGPGRPALPPEERRRRVDLRLAPETLLGLDVLAEARGTTRSGAVDQLVAEALSGASSTKRMLDAFVAKWGPLLKSGDVGRMRMDLAKIVAEALPRAVRRRRKDAR